MERYTEPVEVTSTRLNAKELMSVLEGVDPEAVIVITLGDHENPYRRRVTKATCVKAVAVYDQNDKPLLGTEIQLKADGPLY